MAEPGGAASERSSHEVAEALAAARGLLEGAEADAARIRAEAQRHARRRGQDAELLVAKARRVLSMAEAKAATIVAQARVEADAGGDAHRTGGDEIDLTDRGEDGAVPAGRRVAVGAGAASASGRPSARPVGELSSLDRLLADAVASAVGRALRPDGP